MKKLFLILGISMMACTNEDVAMQEKVLEVSCINATADKSFTVGQISKSLVGTWALKQVISMLPNPKVPDIKFKFLANDNLEIFEAGVLKQKVKYTLEAKESNSYKYVQIKANGNGATPSELESMVNGTIRSCETEFIIDQGMAYDAPAYIFRKE